MWKVLNGWCQAFEKVAVGDSAGGPSRQYAGGWHLAHKASSPLPTTTPPPRVFGLSGDRDWLAPSLSPFALSWAWALPCLLSGLLASDHLAPAHPSGSREKPGPLKMGVWDYEDWLSET